MKIVNSKLKVAVLTGGIGQERDISIQSGNCVAQGLKEAGFNIVFTDIRPDNIEILDDDSIDVFFVAMHGEFGEDGQLQEILEDKSLLYTGSGPAESKLAFDKIASKKVFSEAGIDTPAAIEFNPNADAEKLAELLQQPGDKYVVKPIRQGSSVGISIVRGLSEAVSAAERTLSGFDDCMIEEFIPGREITVGVLCGKPLPVIEIRPKEDFYNYRAKYIDERTEFLFDTIKGQELTSRINNSALDCYNSLGCRHFARVDSILGNDGVVYVLEVNTIPGFTTHSLLPKAAARAGLSMSDLCVRIIEAALKNKNGPVRRLETQS